MPEPDNIKLILPAKQALKANQALAIFGLIMYFVSGLKLKYMIKVLFTVGMFFISHLSFCQSIDNISSKQVTQDTTDDGKVFYRAEKMPEFIEGTHALEDTLIKKLSDYKSVFNGQIIKCVLTVTKGGSLKKIQNSWIGGSFSFEVPLIKALRSTSGLWKPAEQNGHLITAVKGFLIVFNKETLHIREFEF